jgi:hypothetical protein
MSAPSNYYNRLVVQETPYMSNWMTDTNHLRAYLGNVEPQKVDNLMNTLFMNRRDYSTPLLAALEKPATTMLLDGVSDNWTWDADKQFTPAKVVENLESGNNTPGINKEPFRIKLDRNWFTDGDVLTADAFSGRNVRVIDNGVTQSTDGWIYTVQLVTEDATEYFPAAYLAEGQEFKKLYSIYGELNDKGSKVIHAGKMKMMNGLGGEIRTDLGISDWADALTIQVSSVTFDRSGKPVRVNDSRWFKRDELAAWEQHRRMKENYLFFGTAGTNLSGASGYDVRSSMGMWQMLHLGNVNYYSQLSTRVLQESIGDMFYQRVPAELRNVELYTGEAGFTLFHEAVTRNLNGLGGLIPLEKFIDGRGMDMTFGYQFKAYRMLNGGTITLKHLKTLDDYDTKAERGNGKFGRMSATFLGLDMSPDGTENCKIVKRNTRQEDYWGYIPGTASPFGPVKGGMSATKKAGYDMWINSRVGFHMQDVTKSFILKPTFEF